MKNTFIFLVMLSIIILPAYAGEDLSRPLPRDLAPEEYGLPLPHTDEPTPPPEEPCRALAEWEETEAIIFRWGDYNSILADIIDYVVEVTKAYIICSSTAQAQSCYNYLQSQGVSPLDSVEFLVQATNSVWIRDYAPWWLWRLESWDRAMYEWNYNRPRPLDDVIPEWLSNIWNIEYYGLDITHTGGNWLLDGWSRAYCSQLILQENFGLTAQRVTDLFNAYASLDTVPLAPAFFGINHLNMWAKLLNDHTVMVNQYPAGSPHNWAMEATVEMFSNLTNEYGRPFDIVRVQTPNWLSTPYTYCNSLIVMNRVIVPVYNMHPYDEEALALYAEYMPGYEIYAVNCTGIIGASGAVNCITHNIPNPELIYITHTPLQDTENTTEPYPLVCEIACLGTLDEDSLHLYWRSEVSPVWSEVLLLHNTGMEYQAEIPPCPGGMVEYYLRAVSEGGCWTTVPRYGPGAHYSFLTGPSGVDITLTPQGLPIIIPIGGGSFSYGIELSNSSLDPREFDVWMGMVIPDGDTIETLVRNGITLAAGAALTRNLNQRVPGNAQAGDYTYFAACGTHYSNTIYSQDSFPFSKAGSEVNLRGNEGWKVYGWDNEGAPAGAMPAELRLEQNYPNPFNVETEFGFTIPAAGRVRLEVFNVQGQLVGELFRGQLSAGEYSIKWRGESYSSGVYLVRLEMAPDRGTAEQSRVKKAALIK